MSKRRQMTAAELVAELQRDAEFQQRDSDKERAREARQKEYDELIHPFLLEMNRRGFDGETLQAIVQTHSPLPNEAVDVLLEALERLSEPRSLESIVRALGAAQKPFNGMPLACCFDSTSDQALRWAIVNTIALVRPHSIDDWLAELRKSAYWDKTWSQLGREY